MTPNGAPMPITIVKDAKLFSAEVTDGEGGSTWHSPHPMRVTDLVQALEERGCPRSEIASALAEAGLPLSWGQFADLMQALVENALAGKREVPEPDQYAEAWISYARFLRKSPSLLEDVVAWADAINHAIPTADEVAWAFLRLEKRGWLSVEGAEYVLSQEARRTIEAVTGEGTLFAQLVRLKDWMLEHSP